MMRTLKSLAASSALALAVWAVPGSAEEAAAPEGTPVAEGALLETPAHIPARPLRITGSSSVAPFALVAGSTVRSDDGERLPLMVEATGTSAGFAALCGAEGAVVIAASRPIDESELDRCGQRGVTTVVEVELGLGAIVFAQSSAAAPMALTLEDIFRAASARVPDAECRLVPNRARRWSDIRSDLPNRPIRLFGPPARSGTRDELIRQGLSVGARNLPCLAKLAAADPEAFDAAMTIRRDGAWIDAGESDGALAYALTRLPDGIGIFGRVHALAQDGLDILPVDGVRPDTQTIAENQYPLSRPLYLYTTAKALTSDPRVRPIVRTFANEAATGPDGVLSGMGLVTNPNGSEARLLSTADGSATPVSLGR